MKYGLLAGLATLAMALAACGGQAAPSSPAAPAGSAAAASGAPRSSPVSNPSAPVSSGAAASTSALASTSPIKIGLIEPLTGGLANNGKDNVDGFNLYLESVNSTVAGRKIQPIAVDTQGQADAALAKTKQLVDGDKVQVLAGIVSTPVCYAVAEYVKTAHVPLALTSDCGAENVMTDAKFASPYLVRFCQVASEVDTTAADWAYKQGYRKAIMLSSDYGGGLEHSDAFGIAFVKRGGAIVQEIHPPLGTTDFGPYLSQLNQQADVLWAFAPGTDGLRLTNAFSTYASGRKLQVVDSFATLTGGANLEQEGDKAVGVVALNYYSQAYDSPANQAFLRAFHQKYPTRIVSAEVAQGYAGAQAIEAAIKKVNGNVENKQAFLDALYATNLGTAKGPLKLDQQHDVIQNTYAYRVTKEGSTFGEKLLDTYKQLNRNWDLSSADQKRFSPFGKLKGKWVGMTSAQLDQVK